MKLHFRYHPYLYSKKGGTVYDGCKYCQDRSINGNSVSMASEDEKGDSGKEYYSDADKK